MSSGSESESSGISHEADVSYVSDVTVISPVCRIITKSFHEYVTSLLKNVSDIPNDWKEYINDNLQRYNEECRWWAPETVTYKTSQYKQNVHNFIVKKTNDIIKDVSIEYKEHQPELTLNAYEEATRVVSSYAWYEQYKKFSYAYA